MFLQDDIDSLSGNRKLRNDRMLKCANYFKEKYGIWKV